MVIRDAVASDRQAVLALTDRLAAFGPPAHRTHREIADGERRMLESAGIPPGPPSRLLVIELPELGVAGFAYLEERRDYFTGERHGHVGILAVAEHAQGRGLGRALLAAAESWARASGYRLLTLNVFAGNTRARRIYEAYGFEAEVLSYRKPVQ